MTGRQPPGPGNSLITGGVLGLIVLLIVGFYVIAHVANPHEGNLVDPDSYMRMVRALHIMETGDWYNPTLSRSGEIPGETSHWTHPIDVVLISGAVPLSLFYPLQDALLYWVPGMMLLLGLGAVLAALWAFRPFLPPNVHVFTGLFLVIQPGVFSYLLVARPDHHVLIIILFLAVLGVALRMAENLAGERTALAGGIAAGISMWVSVEALLPLAMVYGGLGFLWCLGRDHLARGLTAFSLGLLVAMALALAAERPLSGIFSVEYDRLSVVHLTFTLLMVAAWSLLARAGGSLSGNSLSSRLGLAVFAALAAGIIMLGVYPDFFGGPVGLVPARAIDVFFSHIPDNQPLYSSNGILFTEIPLYLGSALAALCFVLWRIFKEPSERSHQIFLFFGLLFFIGLALVQRRFFLYAQMLAVLPLLEMLVSLEGRSPRLFQGRKQVLTEGFAVLILATVFTYGPTFVKPVAGFKEPPSGIMCNPARLNALLKEVPGGEGAVRRIFADPRDTPELLFRNSHFYFTAGYHRQSDRIIEFYDAMTSPGPDPARELFNRHGLNTVLVCMDPARDAVYGGQGMLGNFYGRLKNNLPPDWLRPLAARDIGPTSYRLYETVSP